MLIVIRKTGASFIFFCSSEMCIICYEQYPLRRLFWSHVNFTYTKSSNTAAIFCHIRSDPDAVAKSLHNFVNYGKRKEESVAELPVTLLVKLFSVEKLWAKGLCESTYEASWLSKTKDSKVFCINGTDPDVVVYGKRKKESVAELLITLLVKSVEKLWSKELCRSTYEESWLSKTWDSKVCCISIVIFHLLMFVVLSNL
ncbi:hypothetical protein MTR67_030856 [Solanum verrucosum]|uniref:Uncharacterized protein n=1 Tax=Solanum verrucosum TaxID=315347 RepID=A0AAF0ZCT2_SOLVR|nr:hypothetical protein MTR67_030856 [Solanum verrucosum]